MCAPNQINVFVTFRLNCISLVYPANRGRQIGLISGWFSIRTFLHLIQFLPLFILLLTSVRVVELAEHRLMRRKAELTGTSIVFILVCMFGVACYIFCSGVHNLINKKLIQYSSGGASKFRHYRNWLLKFKTAH